MIVLVHMTDWQFVLRRVPYIRGKFPPLEIKEDNGGEEEDGETNGDE